MNENSKQPSDRTGRTERLWNTKTCAAYLGYSTRYVYRLAREGILPARKRGARWFFSPSEVREWVGF